MEQSNKILVIEDHCDTRKLVQAALEPEGYEVLAVKNGAHAIQTWLDHFRCQPSAGIMTDLALGDINGLRLMSGIREFEHGTLGCVPIRMAVMSGSTELVPDGTFERLGVTLVLPKPLPRLQELRQKVKGWLEAPPPSIIPVEITGAPSYVQAAWPHPATPEAAARASGSTGSRS